MPEEKKNQIEEEQYDGDSEVTSAETDAENAENAGTGDGQCSESESTMKGIETLFERVMTLSTELDVAKTVAAKEKTRAEDMKALADRLQADFDNYRKRTNENAKRAKEDAAAEVIEKFLPVLDALNHGAAAVKDENAAKGIRMISRQFTDVLFSLGVEEIPALNEQFDPNFHNAVMQVPAKKGEQPNTVAEVFGAGYKLNEKVIRYSVVKVRS